MPEFSRDPYPLSMFFREANRTDLPAVIGLLVDDVLGKNRDHPVVDEAYERAFDAIDADARNFLIVAVEPAVNAGPATAEVHAAEVHAAEALDTGAIAGCMQLTFIPGLGRHGAERCLIEAVRIRSDLRGQGVGGEMIGWAIEQARERGCALVQLTTDKTRANAHRFYERLGFVASHEGMKLAL